MANTLKTTDLVARDSSIILSDNLVAAQLVNRNHEQELRKKVGDSVEIALPPIQAARDLNDDSGTTQANDITDTSENLQLTEWPYVKVTLGSKEKSLELNDFIVQVVNPNVLAIRDAIDAYILKVGAAGFAENLIGTDGTDPSTHAHILAGRKGLNDNQCPMANRYGVVNTTAAASFLGLDEFTSSDYGSNRPQGLKEATMGRLAGIDWFESQNVVDHTRGDVAQATHTAAQATASTTLTMDDNGGTSVGTLYKGARFTVAGDSTVYTVVADSTAVAGVFTLTLDQVITVANNVAVTWKTASTGNIIWSRNAIAAAIIAPDPLAVESSVASYNNIGIRVSMDSSLSSMGDTMVFDTFLGATVVQPKAGVVLQG